MINTRQNVHTLTEISLAKYQTWSIEGNRRGEVISCKSGLLWITQEGDMKDYIIEAGRNFWVTRPGTVVVQALDNSKFKYSLNEMQDHVEVNQQPIHQSSSSRVSH